MVFLIESLAPYTFHDKTFIRNLSQIWPSPHHPYQLSIDKALESQHISSQVHALSIYQELFSLFLSIKHIQSH